MYRAFSAYLYEGELPAMEVSKRSSIFSHLFAVDREDRKKLLFLSAIFFLIIAGYTLAKDLKDAVFMSVVGKDYAPHAKVLSMFALVVPMLLYSRIVDKMRRYQVLCVCSAFFGIGGLIFAYFIGHPTIGIANTQTSPARLFGWLFYFFVEGYSPFVVSVFWAFANSVNSPESARKNYGLMVAGSKLGGVLSAGCAWLLFTWIASLPHSYQYDALSLQAVYIVSSIFLLSVPLFVGRYLHRVPKESLHGYEAAYLLEKKRKKEQSKQTGTFSGLKVLLKYPYVMGIFGMVFFYEIVATVITFIRLGEADKYVSVASKCSYLFGTILITHFCSLLISMFGTRYLLEKLGERFCLVLAPLISGALLLYFVMTMNKSSLILTFSALRAVNFAFFWPVRESLYIPTVKEVKFKSKAWIDGIGVKLSKGAASLYNGMVVAARQADPVALFPVLVVFFLPAILIWIVVAYLLGKRFDQVIERNEVIGQEEFEGRSEESSA